MAYYDMTEVKARLGIDDTSYDTLLTNLGDEADQAIEDILKPWVSTIPITGAELTPTVRSAANLFLMYRFWMYQKNTEMYNIHKKEFEFEIARAKSQLMENTTTTYEKHVVYAKDYRTEPLASRDNNTSTSTSSESA